jgi:quinol monooxygenase YgiN
LIHLIVTFEASAEKLPAFRQILQQVKAELPQVPGCKAVRIFKSTTNERVFTLVETWESESAHRAHIERVIQTGAWEHIRAHLVTDPLSSYLREV